MNTTYHYVVLRLAPEPERGEIINVGIVLFHQEQAPRVLTLATLNKLRALDSRWDTKRLAHWTENVQAVIDANTGTRTQIEALERFSLCEVGAVGMFSADTEDALKDAIKRLKSIYISDNSSEKQPKRSRRTRLQTALRAQFKRMHVLGVEIDALAEHKVVPNVPVPGHDELKSDFVYKNGVYRITQTMDYNVAPDSLHNKLTEACVKSTAADMALKTYGPSTSLFAVVDIPQDFLDAADSHLDLLLARGFEIFHFDDPVSMAQYMQVATPSSIALKTR